MMVGMLGVAVLAAGTCFLGLSRGGRAAMRAGHVKVATSEDAAALAHVGVEDGGGGSDGSGDESGGPSRPWRRAAADGSHEPPQALRPTCSSLPASLALALDE